MVPLKLYIDETIAYYLFLFLYCLLHLGSFVAVSTSLWLFHAI
jgi:hypothetical protein